MNNAPSDVFNTVSDHITAMKDRMTLKATDVVCSECSHTWTVEVTMDQANFFGVKSQR